MIKDRMFGDLVTSLTRYKSDTDLKKQWFSVIQWTDNYLVDLFAFSLLHTYYIDLSYVCHLFSLTHTCTDETPLVISIYNIKAPTAIAPCTR